MAMAWPKETARVLTELTGEARPDVAMLIVMKDAVAHRLEQIELAQKQFQAKYGMTFEEYKKKWDAEDKEEDYSYETEFDYLEWEVLGTRQARLEKLRAGLGM